PEAGRERRHESVEPGLRLVALAAVHEAREDRAAVERRRGRGAAVRLVGPGTAAVPRAEGEERARVVREEEPPVADGRRKLEQARAAGEPEPAERRAQADPLGEAGPRRVEAVHRPRDLAQLG